MGTETKKKNVPIYFYYLTIAKQKKCRRWFQVQHGSNCCIFFGNAAACPFPKLE